MEKSPNASSFSIHHYYGQTLVVLLQENPDTLCIQKTFFILTPGM